MEITSKFIIIKFRIIVKITNYKFTYDLGNKNRAFILFSWEREDFHSNISDSVVPIRFLVSTNFTSFVSINDCFLGYFLC